MSAPTEMINLWLGMHPFILVEVTGLDDDDNPVLHIRFGGGFEEDNIAEFLGDVSASLVPEEPQQ